MQTVYEERATTRTASSLSAAKQTAKAAGDLDDTCIPSLQQLQDAHSVLQRQFAANHSITLETQQEADKLALQKLVEVVKDARRK